MSGSASPPERVLADLKARLRESGAPVLHGLNNGLSPDTAKRLFDRAAISADPALIALYAWQDGARGSGSTAELLPGLRFLPLGEAIQTRGFELRLAAENEDLPDHPAASFFDPGWFPILVDAAGNLYVVERSGAGRVLTLDREQPGFRGEAARSLMEFLDGILRDGADRKPPSPSDAVAVLVRDLESDRPEKRLEAVRELTRKRPPAAFDPLVAMLDSTDGEARRQAALVLGQLHDRRAIPILIHRLAEWRGEDVASAWGRLLAIGTARPFDHLVDALAGGDAGLRVDAIQGLVISRDPRAPAAIKPATSDPDPAVRLAADVALRQLRGY